VEKNVRIDVMNPGLNNGSIDVYVNGKECFHKYYTNESRLNPPGGYNTTLTKTTGISIELKVIETFSNTSLVRTFNPLMGDSFSISFFEEGLSIYQFSGDPHYK
jgi:hypothetical protein